MDNKNSFVLYGEYIEELEMLPLEEVGRLTMAIFAYVNYGEVPELNGMTKMAFAFIKKQMDRDRQKWEDTVNKRKEAGKKGMAKRWSNNETADDNEDNKNNKNNNVINAITNITDNVDVDVNEDVNEDVNVNVNDNEDVDVAEPSADRPVDNSRLSIYERNKDFYDFVEKLHKMDMEEEQNQNNNNTANVKVKKTFRNNKNSKKTDWFVSPNGKEYMSVLEKLCSMENNIKPNDENSVRYIQMTDKTNKTNKTNIKDLFGNNCTEESDFGKTININSLDLKKDNNESLDKYGSVEVLKY